MSVVATMCAFESVCVCVLVLCHYVLLGGVSY